MPKTTETPVSKFSAWLLPPGLTVYAAIFVFVNVLFLPPYAARISVGPAWAITGYLLFFGLQLLAAAGIARWAARSSHPRLWPFLVLGIYLVTAWVAYRRIDPESLHVDRWSALDHFLAALFRGEFPYQARTHLNLSVSGFPGLFLMALPFYALGDVGYLQLAALAAFTALLVARFRDGGRPLYVLLALLAMPLFEHQLLTRSDLFSNMVAAACLLHASQSPGAGRGNRLWLWAAAWGLVLSTRAIVLIPLILAAGPLLNGRGWKASLAFFSLAGAVCLATFLPFYLWDPALFREHNPFDVQSRKVTPPVLAVVLAVSCALAYFYRTRPRPFQHAGFVLFATVLACWIFNPLKFDVSYLFLGVPFLLVALGDGLPRPIGNKVPS